MTWKDKKEPKLGSFYFLFFFYFLGFFGFLLSGAKLHFERSEKWSSSFT